jgi:uncharacterized phage-associated protein
VSPSEWLLIFVAALPERPVDPVRLQKGMFLLAMRGSLVERERYRFEPYAYGPMSRALYRDLREHCRAGLVEQRPVPGHAWRTAQATGRGLARAQELRAAADEALVASVDAIRHELDGLSFAELLARVYAQYPDYAVRSVFQLS